MTAMAKVDGLTLEVANMKEKLEAKVSEMDSRISVLGGEVAKLPALEGKVNEGDKRPTEYTESPAIN